MESENTMMKFPYLGYSPNLIEYFVIMGYEENLIKHEILTNYFNEPKEVYEMTVLNSISSKTEMDMIDNEVIMKLVHPKPPQILTSCTTSEPKNSSVIFFLNADTVGDLSKVPFHGCALTFYENFVTNSTQIFIPKTFCIISQYPFFTLFNSINREILNLFNSKGKNEIPIEIVLYNIVNFLPSPINYGLNLSLFMNRDLNSYMTNSSFYTHSSSGSLGSSEIRSTMKNPLTSVSNSVLNNNVVQLNGYPVLDFNLSEIFNILPMNMVIEVLIFNFLEFDMLFFSKNLEVLNFAMYIIASLNYPCNDSIYLWHILSVSQEELITSDSSQFVGKPWAAMMGVNCTYNNTIDSCKVVDSHFIVDLDNKNFFFKFTENNDDTQKTNSLLNYIRKIIKEYNLPSFFLAKNIKNLLKELEIISKQVIYNSNYTHSQTPNENVNFFEMNDKIRILNKNIQEAFYDFILNILTVFYNNYFLNSSFDKKKVERQANQPNSNFFIHYNEDTSKFSKEEAIFYMFFKSSNKYNNYILNFIQEYRCINLYKIPLIFSEEFIYLKKYSEDKLFKSLFFEIIENFYSEGGNKKPLGINFNRFYAYYNAELKNYFQDEISSGGCKVKSTKHEVNNKAKYIYDYNSVEFDNEVLLKYIYILNNLTEDFKEEIFPSLLHKNNNEIKSIKFSEIVDTVEKNMIAHKILKADNLIVFSLITMFIITRFQCNFNESISNLRDILEIVDTRNFFLRKYLNLILSIYNITPKDLYEDSTISSETLGENLPKSVRKHLYTNKMCIYMIINFLRNKNILPNEPMMNFFEDFFTKADKIDEDLIQDILMEEEIDAIADFEKFNLFLQFHYCRDGTKKPEYFIKQAENALYEGDIILECNTCQTKETRTGLVFKFDFSNVRHVSEIFTPYKLYNTCNRLLFEFTEHHDFNRLDKELINKIIINIVFYCKNMPQTTGKMTYKFLLKFMDY